MGSRGAFVCKAIDTDLNWVILNVWPFSIGLDHETLNFISLMFHTQIYKQRISTQNLYIILTHLDLDHYAGLINADNTLAFPNADVHICREAWALFTSASFYEGNDTYDRREHLSLIEDQVKLVECAGEFLPGFSMIPLPGHREHHLGIMVESNGEKLLFAADTVCRPLHIKYLDWHCGADSDHGIARETRIKFAKMASESGCLVLLYHFDFPGLGHVIQDGNGWKWQPLEI